MQKALWGFFHGRSDGIWKLSDLFLRWYEVQLLCPTSQAVHAPWPTQDSCYRCLQSGAPVMSEDSLEADFLKIKDIHAIK